MIGLHAAAFVTVKSLDSAERTIEGWASKPECDRIGDVVESSGCIASTPLPLLLDHDHVRAVGLVQRISPSRDGVRFVAKIAKPPEAGPLATLCSDAWQMITAGLRSAVSIGFRSIEAEPMQNGGRRFKKWELMELSLVSVPALASAKIDVVRSIAQQQRRATGRVVRLTEADLAAARLALSDRPVSDAMLDWSTRADPRDLADLTGAGFVEVARSTDAALQRLEARLRRLEGRRDAT